MVLSGISVFCFGLYCCMGRFGFTGVRMKPSYFPVVGRQLVMPPMVRLVEELGIQHPKISWIGVCDICVQSFVFWAVDLTF